MMQKIFGKIERNEQKMSGKYLKISEFKLAPLPLKKSVCSSCNIDLTTGLQCVLNFSLIESSIGLGKS